MIDINLIRKAPEIVKANFSKRNNEFLLQRLERVIQLDSNWKESQNNLNMLRSQVNKVAKQVANAVKTNDIIRVEKLIEGRTELSKQIKLAESNNSNIVNERNNLLMTLPNLLRDDVPIGTNEKDNMEIKRWGTPIIRDIKSHGELVEERGLADFESARESIGAGFVYIKGNLARLDLALQIYALDALEKRGFEIIQVPLMLNGDSYRKVTDMNDFHDVMFKIEDEDKYLIATSEHSIAAMMKNKVIEDKLPLKYAGISPCFRKEIGSKSVDTRGLFRMHQFNKIEQFIFCTPGESNFWLEELIKTSEFLFRELEIPHRVVSICSGDIGTVAAKKYDIEAWSPRQNKWIEVVSGSNCTDYQARRLNIKYGKRGGETQFVHTLNCTAIATSRAMVAILENHQDESGKVSMPKVLHKYIGVDSL